MSTVDHTSNQTTTSHPDKQTPLTDTLSPFHRGEQIIQQRVGVREQVERFGGKVIRDYMPDQHREFYQQLPYVFVGHTDENGWPWTSMLFGDSGFIQSATPKTLSIQAAPVNGDPLAKALARSQHENTALRLGLIGIELPTRRRNRLSAHVTHIEQVENNGTANDIASAQFAPHVQPQVHSRLHLQVDQSFGNCPQYIQGRQIITQADVPRAASRIVRLNSYDDAAKDLITQSDTFFVTSCVAASTHTSGSHAAEGVDVSHRGGKPGFVRVDDNHSLTIPDYLGNFHFNTLGNFLENPKAGLLFIDFKQGHLLSLTGTVEILWDDPDCDDFEGAERLWRFRLDHGVRLENVLPMQWSEPEYSPNTLFTDSWQQAAQRKQAEANRHQWQTCQIVDIQQESPSIKSFVLRPEAGKHLPFQPGQYLTVKADIPLGDGTHKEVIRTYTISNAPADSDYRISVKHEKASESGQADGEMSTYLHRYIQPGDTLQIKAALGDFVLNSNTDRPVLLLAAGVGITPMLAMARHNLLENIRARRMRPMLLVQTTRQAELPAFRQELEELKQLSHGLIRPIWCVSDLLEHDPQQHPDILAGRVNKATLQQLLPIDDYDVYLCGPQAFMQSLYDQARELGIADYRIHAEAFGPASLTRQADGNINTSNHACTDNQGTVSVDEAIVTFEPSGVEQAWNDQQSNLLEFAEAHGLSPDYGCRSGNCGSCKVKLIDGEVHYPGGVPTIPLEKNEVLLCCATPGRKKSSEDKGLATLTLDL